MNRMPPPLKSLGGARDATAHQLVSPLYLLLHVFDGEATDVLAVRVRRHQRGGEELEGQQEVA